jgi:pilus assembly protein Flp/PilA
MRIAQRGPQRVRARTDDGASAVEYGLIIAAIAAVLVFAAISLGRITRSLFTDSCERFEGQINSGATCENGASG